MIKQITEKMMEQILEQMRKLAEINYTYDDIHAENILVSTDMNKFVLCDYGSIQISEDSYSEDYDREVLLKMTKVLSNPCY